MSEDVADSGILSGMAGIKAQSSSFTYVFKKPRLDVQVLWRKKFFPPEKSFRLPMSFVNLKILCQVLHYFSMTKN